MSFDFKRLKVGTLLSVGVLLIIGLMILATVYSNFLTTNAQSIISKSTTRIFDVLEIQRDTGELFSAMEDVVVYQDQKRLEEARTNINSLNKRAEETINKAGDKKVFNKSELERAQSTLVKANEVTERIIKTKIMSLNLSEESAGSDRNYDTGEQLTQIRSLGFEMDGIFDDIRKRSDEEYRGAMNTVQKAQYITWFVIGISITLSGFLAIFLVRSVKSIFDLKNEFVNIIAHDLRNPVTAINGYIQIIGDKLKNEKGLEEDLQAINVSALKLGYQINNLLEVGRTEAGRTKLNLESLDPFEVIKESVTRAKALADISGIKISYKKESGKIYILADRSKLSDVLDNLISNAIKYNKKNGVVSITTKETDGMFNISVADSGQGIPKDQQKNIFKKYSRAGAEKKKIPGTGLGLYASKISMDQMKGSITFISKENEGTTFTATFRKALKK